MTDEVNITQNLLNEAVSEFLSAKLTHLTLGTGDADITLATEDVENPIDIDTTRNLYVDTTTINENFLRLLFKLTFAMPVDLPVDYQQMGIHNSATATTGLKWGRTLPVAITKDNNSQHNIVISGRVIELETINLAS